jgi:hypothetical protein
MIKGLRIQENQIREERMPEFGEDDLEDFIEDVFDD